MHIKMFITCIYTHFVYSMQILWQVKKSTDIPGCSFFPQKTHHGNFSIIILCLTMPTFMSLAHSGDRTIKSQQYLEMFNRFHYTLLIGGRFYNTPTLFTFFILFFFKGIWYSIFFKVIFSECYLPDVFETNWVVLKKKSKMWTDDRPISDWQRVIRKTRLNLWLRLSGWFGQKKAADNRQISLWPSDNLWMCWHQWNISKRVVLLFWLFSLQ